MVEARRPLRIFVHRASECLTDREAHGDGLICYSVLSGLAARGHRIIAFTDRSAVEDNRYGIEIVESTLGLKLRRLPATIRGYALAREANELIRKRGVDGFDVIWRMYPYGAGCSITPGGGRCPYIIGPLSMGARMGLWTDLRSPIAAWARLRWRKILRAASGVVVNTDGHKERLRRALPRALICSIPVPLDPPNDLGRIGLRSPPSNESLRLAFVGHLTRNKNPRVPVAIVGALRQRGVRATLNIVGDGPEDGIVRRRVIAENLCDAVTLHGRIPHRDVYAIMRDAHVMLSCSIGESYGRVLAEAMTVGTPCMAHASGGPQDVMSSTGGGWLVKDVTASAYVAHVEQFLRNPEDWIARSRRALTASKRWATEKVIEQYERLLYQVVETHGFRGEGC
jgi:glycosyltransferase involved in cell wall biosynthesis